MARGGLTVGSLRALTRDMRDDTVVLVPSADREGYDRATVSVQDVQRHGTNEFTDPDPGGGPVIIKALVIS
jgi:hypothetical protein